MKKRLRGYSAVIGMVALGLVCVFTGTACTQQRDKIEPAATEVFIKHSIENIAIPKIIALAEKSKKLDASIQVLCNDINQLNLKQSQQDWIELNHAFNLALPLMFGIADKIRISWKLNERPTHALVLNAITKGDVAEDMLKDRSVRGFAAVEMLLFGDPAYPVDLKLWSTGQYCKHLLDISNEINTLNSELSQAWSAGYKKQFLDLAPEQALSIIYAEILNTIDSILWQRIWVPAGFFRGDVNIEQLEAWRSAQSLPGLKASIETLAVLITGTKEIPGITALFVTRYPDDAYQINDIMNTILQIVNNIKPPLKDAMLNDIDLIKNLSSEIDNLKDLLVESAKKQSLKIIFEEDGD